MQRGPPPLLLTILSGGGGLPAGNGMTMIAGRSFGGVGVRLTNLDKVLFPRDGVTKGDMIDYYARIAPTMLLHLRGRPVMLARYPDGLDGKSFYQKEAPSRHPAWLRTAAVRKAGGSLRQVVCEKQADLAYLANLACITPHVWLSREGRLDRPDRLIFDLDPHAQGFGLARSVALELRAGLDALGMSAFVMTTGSEGLHVVAPLDRSAPFERSRDLAREVARRIARGREDEITLEASKAGREDRLFIDIFRNAYGQTGVAPYAVRARDGAPVAAPLRWEEVEDGRTGPQSFNVRNVFRRLEEAGDPWRGIDERPASVDRARSALGEGPP